MLSNMSLGKYYLGNSLIHKLSPVFKIVSFLIMLVSIFFINGYVDIIMLGSYLILSLVYSDINIDIYIKNILSMKILLLILLLADLVFSFFGNSFFLLFKIVFIILYASIISYTTSVIEVSYGIQKILYPFNKYLPVNDIALIVSNSMRYIPMFIEERETVEKVEIIKGICSNEFSIKEKIIYDVQKLEQIFMRTYRKSKKIYMIMNMRLYNYGKLKTNYQSNKWGFIDSLLLVLNILILMIVIFY